MANYTINSIQIGDDTYNINDFDSLNVNGTITGNIVSAHGVVLAEGDVNFKTLRLQDGSTGNIDCLGVFTESHSSLF